MSYAIFHESLFSNVKQFRLREVKNGIPFRCQLFTSLKVHKREKFFSSDFEFFTIIYLVKLKY